MTPRLAEQIRAAGNTLQATEPLYAAALAAQSSAGIECLPDQAYGDHPRHRLDVYRPVVQTAAPVVVFLHGGGFVRGSKEQRRNIGIFLAQQGYVAVLPNYRLAPECRWPSGAEDVVAVQQWVARNADVHGGDPQRIVLAGESAGAAHVAAATLRAEFHPGDWCVAGVVLLSGPYNVRMEGMAREALRIPSPDPRNDAYYGAEPAGWDQASTVDHITAAPFPLLISFTELDMPQMQVQAGELFARLVSRHGFQPALQAIPFHNHFSQSYSIGTEDTSVSEPLLAFLEKVAGKP
jgi:acetyl esterase/lipase